MGDIPGNAELVIKTAEKLMAQERPDVIVFPELVLTAYPPEDLLLRASLDIRIESALAAIRACKFDSHLVIGYPGREEGRLYNMLCVIYQGNTVAHLQETDSSQLSGFR